MDLGRGDQIDAQLVLVQDTKDGHEEAMRAGALLAVDVQHRDSAFDGDGGGPLRGLVVGQRRQQVLATVVAEEAWFAVGEVVDNVGPDDRAVVDWVLDVLDPDRDRRFDDLLHGEGMDHFGAVEGQLDRKSVV